MALSNPFNGKPFSPGIPGVPASGLAKLDQAKVKAGSEHVARLSAALAKLPSAPSSRGNAKDLFLP